MMLLFLNGMILNDLKNKGTEHAYIVIVIMPFMCIFKLLYGWKNQPNSEKKETKTQTDASTKQNPKTETDPEPYSGLCSYEMTWDQLAENMAWLNRQTDRKNNPS